MVLISSGLGARNGSLPEFVGIILDSPYYNLGYDHFISVGSESLAENLESPVLLRIGNIRPIHIEHEPSSAPSFVPGEGASSPYRQLAYIAFAVGGIGLLLAIVLPITTCYRSKSACFRKNENKTKNHWVTDEETTSLLSVNPEQ